MARQRGFTLIEVLVVITIIAGLMGLGFVMLGKATNTKNETLTRNRLVAITGALHQLKGHDLLGDYPSADPRAFRGLKGEDVGKEIGFPNDTNLGIETVYVAVFLNGHTVTVEYDEKWLGNTDADNTAGSPTRTGAKELFEFVDAWGNPYAYFSARELKNPEGLTKYVMGTGAAVEARPWVEEKTKLPLMQGKFQLFSAGIDGIFNTKDDIGNW
jgi:prepilin-type N-terminal cleavage/methylation domain-containing protein